LTTIVAICYALENLKWKKMPRRRINIILTIKERKYLKEILKSYTSTAQDRLKAQVLLSTDVGKHGPKSSSNDIATVLNISSRSVGRIKEAYGNNSSIKDLFSYSNLSNQSKLDRGNTQNTQSPKHKIPKYVEIDNSSEETFLSEHIKCRVTLTKEEREYVQRVIKEGKQSSRRFNRARILLQADEGLGGPAMLDGEISDKLDVSPATVARVRRLFVTEGGIEAVLNFNHYRAGRPPKIDGTVQATLVAQACSKPPEGRCRWTVRLLADRLVELEVIDSISPTAVATALKKMNLNLGSGRNG
jgi:hypothetical protein